MKILKIVLVIVVIIAAYYFFFMKKKNKPAIKKEKNKEGVSMPTPTPIVGTIPLMKSTGIERKHANHIKGVLLIYVVQSGDTLFKLANKYKKTIKEIVAINPQIKNINRIKVGDKIKIPN